MRIVTKAAVFISVAVLTACGGGSKVLKEPQPMQVVQPLSKASDDKLAATLDWIIVRDNPGTWAKNADWDEYLLQAVNTSEEPIEIVSIAVFDSLGARRESEASRKALVKASKETHRRYKKASTKVMAGRSGVGLFATGTALTVVGGVTAIGAAYGSMLAGTSSAGAAGAIGTGLFLAGPIFAVGGIVRSANNRAVDKEIQKRQTVLPVIVAPGEQSVLDVFFPIAPSPSHLEISYRDAAGAHKLEVDLTEALRGLHLQSLETSDQPSA